MNFIEKIKTPDGINYLNIFLMLLSCLLAFLLPFEVFLFSYAVLGPLHYLTEISWLDKKSYFIKSKWDIAIFILAAIALLIGLFDSKSKINQYSTGIFFTGFLFAFIVLFVKNNTNKYLWIILTFFLFAVFGLNKVTSLQILFAILLPTLIHVFIFTGAFIFYGALKTKSVSGIISLLVFVACGASYFVFLPSIDYTVSGYAQKAYPLFTILNKTLSDLLGIGSIKTLEDVFEDHGALTIMRFIAFAYTYHYLNWFSKTSVIKWHEISKTRMALILILWIFSVVVYAYNYKAGFYTLFFLSILHVFFEFPLNHQTFIGIGKEMGAIVKRKPLYK